MAGKLTLSQLRFLTLESQGLTAPYPFGKGKGAVLKTHEQLGYLQIDTLSVIELAHYHKLWTRIPDYKTKYLDELVDEHIVFEYWFQAASYLPIKDLRFALSQMHKHSFYNDYQIIKEISRNVKSLIKRRDRCYMFEIQSCGPVFKNPEQ